MQIGNEVRRYRVKPLVIRHGTPREPDRARTDTRTTQPESPRAPRAGAAAAHARETE